MPDVQPEPARPKAEYKVRAYSLFAHDLAAIDRIMIALKQRGLKGINRSRVLRIAIAKLEYELETLDPAIVDGVR